MAVDVAIDEKIEKKVKEPSKYKVLFLNDDHTPMDFVIDILKRIFRHTDASARDLTVKVHTEGSAVVGIYSYEVAEQKVIEGVAESRAHGFPLQIKAEQE
jgi:ATP-dependent Clp protease adaptor protein ClpS